jgi:hypothetical protein
MLFIEKTKFLAPMQASRLLPVAIMIAMVLSINAQISFAAYPQNAGETCAREVPSGSIVNPSAGTVTYPNGSVVAMADVRCHMTSIVYGYNGIDASGQQGVGFNQYFTSYQDEWTTPPAPSSPTFGANQGVGLWNALALSNGDILQPLLTWGCIVSTSCSNSWQYTAYSLLSGGPPVFATPYAADSGDTIEGTITYESSYGSCPSSAYYIEAVDVTDSDGSFLTVCTTDKFTAADAGAIEVKNLTMCSQMPGTTSETFSSISYTTSPSGVTATNDRPTPGSFCSPSNTASPFITLGWTD